jgi:hypothetical protein
MASKLMPAAMLRAQSGAHARQMRGMQSVTAHSRLNRALFCMHSTRLHAAHEVVWRRSAWSARWQPCSM